MLATGCQAPAPFRNAKDAVEFLRQSAPPVDQTIDLRGTTQLTVPDARGLRFPIGGLQSRVLMQSPSYLFFDLEDAFGTTVARIGSNEDRYWVELHGAEQKLAWGYWDSRESTRLEELPVEPRQLLEGLLLACKARDLSSGPWPPVMLPTPERRFARSLVYFTADERGWPHVERAAIVDQTFPFTDPYRVQEIQQFDRSGRVTMRIRVSDERAALLGESPSRARIPARIDITWPLEGARLIFTADAGSDAIRIRSLPVEQVYAFPSGWTGTVESLDARSRGPQSSELVD